MARCCGVDPRSQEPVADAPRNSRRSLGKAGTAYRAYMPRRGLSVARPALPRRRYDGDYDHSRACSNGRPAAKGMRREPPPPLPSGELLKKLPPITEETSARQAPPPTRGSAWVSANAGSGKTHVLSQRVIRLLLAGADPSRILCLTYTRAAAANMSNRVSRPCRNGRCCPTPSSPRRSDSRPRSKATRLAGLEALRRALETPGGLKIQTIHAFCEAVLHQFPLEANIAAHFESARPVYAGDALRRSPAGHC